MSSYFNKEHRDVKTRRLVSSIYDLKYFVVETEEEALILENSLIKSHQPRYNILLKDGSSYPYIVITKRFPRILITRDVDTSIHIVYGPFTDVIIARRILYFPSAVSFIRTCRLPLTTDKIATGKFRYCLQYHIKRCKTPVLRGNVSASDYQDNIATAKAILSGDANALVLEEEEKMLSASEALNYEERRLFIKNE